MTKSERAARAHRGVLAAVASVALAVVAAILPTTAASAADGSQFNPGYIISDEVFYNETAMTPETIQAFLVAKSGSCSAGYTCMKDYVQNTPVIAGDQYCNGLDGGTDSAARIIWEIGMSCGINPQVILVLLQKEQSLITMNNLDAGPLQRGHRVLLPRHRPCDPAYQGFVYQVYYAARAFNRYAANPTSFGYRAGQTHNILYNPDVGCGYKSVYVQNQATANLYIYTPYTPNASALANLYGEGDGCASYGNRNFWRLFTDWFGSTISTTTLSQATSLTWALYADVLGREPDPGGLSTWPGLHPVRRMVARCRRQRHPEQPGVLHGADPGRVPDRARPRTWAGGAADWLNRMMTGRQSVDSIRSEFTRSQEFYNLSGGTPSSFVRTLYQTMLNRAPSDGELAYWTNVAATQGRDRWRTGSTSPTSPP